MKSLMVEVKRKHIKAGEPFSKVCPVALAVNDSGFSDARIFLEESTAFRNGEKVSLVLSQKVADFIDRFDNGYSVKPFSFRLRYEG